AGVAGGSEVEVNVHWETAAHVTAGWGNWIAHLLAGRPGAGARAAQLHDPELVADEVTHPDVVIAVNGHRPWAGQTVATDGRERVLASIGTQDRDASAFPSSRSLLRHGGRQGGIGIAVIPRRPQHARQDLGAAP